MKIYDERLPSTDVLSLLAAPRHSSNSLNAPDKQIESSQKLSVDSTNTNEFEMNSITYKACCSSSY